MPQDVSGAGEQGKGSQGAGIGGEHGLNQQVGLKGAET